MNSSRPSMLLAYLVIVTAFSCNYQAKCSDFRIGSYIYYSDYLRSDILITRTDSIQIEKIISSGKIVTSRIVWTNDCEYQTQYLDVNFPISDSDLTYLRNQSIKTKIIRVEQDYYETESLSSGMTKPYRNKIRKVN